MTAYLDELLTKIDTFELVRDKIATILAEETARQKQLAIDAGEDPAPYDLKVYAERATPWDNASSGQTVVNVWFDSANPEDGSSNTVESQTMTGNFNIDIVGFGTNAPGVSGDEAAARNAQRALRLCRNYLMASTYTYLALRPLVGRRWVQSINSFQPQLNDKAAINSVGARLTLAVRYMETSPQYHPVPLDQLSVTINRAEDGSVLAEVEFDYTTT